MLVAAYLISIFLMICSPIFLAAWLRRRFQVPWIMFSIGMLTFTVSQMVHLPLNAWLSKVGLISNADLAVAPPIWQTALLLGLTAGLCEEIARAGGYAFLRKQISPVTGVMLGLGHGGIESMVFGGVMTAATISALLPLAGEGLDQLDITAAQLAVLQVQIEMLLSSPWSAFLPLIERLAAISIHVVFSLIVLQAFTKHQPLYVIVAILYHASIDASLVYVMQRTESVTAAFITFFLTCLPGWLWFIWYFRRQDFQKLSHLPARASEEFRVFYLALQKEFLQQWRTRRALAVLGVFGVFGMTSPLLAYFMPEMMKAIPGAEQFASLVPEPTLGDALTQYIKNISQFGFLLAILTGIGDVAGEKERGTASMILSKPLPRWAFITSKYLAQIILFGMGLILAWAGGILYTVILFEPSDLALLQSQYAWISFLLFAWLLAYLTIGLLGSVLASSVTSAAGISVLGAVGLMLLGSIPQISMLMPGALVPWANQIAASAEFPGFNGGALAATFVLALVGLVTSIALFEQQEL